MEQQTFTRRLFINDVDTFSSRNIAKYLSTCFTEETTQDGDVSPPRQPAFRTVATVSSSSKHHNNLFLLQQYASPTQDELLQRLLECDVVVYNISENATQQQIEEATWAITALHAESENFTTRKMFVLVSTVMTWAMTKPQNPEEADAVLTEEEFRRRRPHPSFRNHNILEKLVLKLGKGSKSKLSSYVVASGLQYGKGENLFHYFFQVSWLLKLPKVPIFGPGTNHVPMIHVHDLARVIENVIELKPKSKYILAVDDSKNTLEDVVKMISDKLGPGEITTLEEQEAVAMKAFTPDELQYLSIDLRLDAFIIKDSFGLRWTSERGMVENMENIVEEYKHALQLHPIKMCLVGPPSVGKTTVSEKLCRRYKIHHIKIKEVIEEKVVKLTGIVNGDDPDSEKPSEDVRAAAHTQLDRINKSMGVNAGRLDDHLVFDILKEKLNTRPCRNQGFVLDGFLKTYDQAQQIFLNEETENQGSEVETPVFNDNITPEHVIALEASDDFLTKRVQGLPESVAEEMRYTPDEFVRRLARHRELSGTKETLLDFFDELEIHPEQIEVTTDDPEYTEVVKKITQMVGIPRNYGLSPEEQEEEERTREEERKQKVAAEVAKKKRGNEAALAEMAAQYEEWQRNVSEVKRQEDELLEARSLPLRNYLMKYVMPSLSEAMLDCCKVKPDDPVDFLAEHLLRHNQGD